MAKNIKVRVQVKAVNILIMMPRPRVKANPFTNPAPK
jgi:hypothetical protein